MPKLLFTPKHHTIGDCPDIFYTATDKDGPVLCIKCNDAAAFILEQMYPEHKPRTEIIISVMNEYKCTEEEAKEAVETVIAALIKKKEDNANGNQ